MADRYALVKDGVVFGVTEGLVAMPGMDSRAVSAGVAVCPGWTYSIGGGFKAPVMATVDTISDPVTSEDRITRIEQIVVPVSNGESIQEL